MFKIKSNVWRCAPPALARDGRQGRTEPTAQGKSFLDQICLRRRFWPPRAACDTERGGGVRQPAFCARKQKTRPEHARFFDVPEPAGRYGPFNHRHCPGISNQVRAQQSVPGPRALAPGPFCPAPQLETARAIRGLVLAQVSCATRLPAP